MFKLHSVSLTFWPLSIVFVISGNRLSVGKRSKTYLWQGSHTEELGVEFIFMSQRQVSGRSNPSKLFLRRNYQ